MSLFPAYAADSEDIGGNDDVTLSELTNTGISLALETQLLDSDSEHEAAEPPTTNVPKTPDSSSEDYYIDRKWDCGNLRVSTLYYPGRPQYEWTKSHNALGQMYSAENTRRGRRRRYYETLSTNPATVELEVDTELAARTKAFRQMIDDDPGNENLWLQFIDFQERCRDRSAGLSAASEAAARVATRRVRAALHRARALALEPHERLDLLRADIAAAGKSSPVLQTELWLRLLSALGACAQGAGELDACAAAAVTATKALPSAYPHVLYVYGAQLRAAGLWEKLVLLLELVTSMNFPPAGFPPRIDPAEQAAIEKQLLDAEDKVINSGLPLSAVWVRVERLRAAAHWRGVGDAAGDAGGDPQRAPLPADVADLLLPLRDAGAAFLLLVNALRLAQVPLMPCTEYVVRATDATADSAGDAGGAAGGAALVALLRAARRLPPAHPARPAARAARALVARAADPPHRFASQAGYLEWETSLWNACLEWTSGAQRVALLCWRLRWLHSLLLLLDMEDETDRSEARRIRSEARTALKRYSDGSPLGFAHFARVERLVAGAPPAAAVALHALRAALRDDTCPAHYTLYIARLVSEVSGEEGCGVVTHAHAHSGAWARACAVLARSLPDDVTLAQPPPTELMDAALKKCEERCKELEEGFECEKESDACEWDGACVCAALLPGVAEWGAARAQLAGPALRRRLLAELRARAHLYPSGSAARYYEQSACALALRAARDQRFAAHARALAPLFPHNALLALACSGAPLWAWESGASQEERALAMCAPRTHARALAHVLPALLRAADAGAPELSRLERQCERAGRGGAGGALLAALRVDAAPHAPRARPEAALYDALQAYPNHKWVYVRGAAWCGAQAAALADALLDRQLRLHALRDELHTLQ